MRWRRVAAGCSEPHRRKLIGVELAAFEVGAQTTGASGEVFGVKSC